MGVSLMCITITTHCHVIILADYEQQSPNTSCEGTNVIL